ncbi:hypothetical protein CEXT_753771 [Caerostris extrusa]|uniref:Reverse transcriptase domain-containing protein n=1 Tax=Caerostris extrusa TaxID=172846 RepID=A0AAV4MNY1_CAEEX|nr:hypothetical protein CEXT_753771 [Caerostris extrusa]
MYADDTAIVTKHQDCNIILENLIRWKIKIFNENDIRGTSACIARRLINVNIMLPARRCQLMGSSFPEPSLVGKTKLFGHLEKEIEEVERHKPFQKIAGQFNQKRKTQTILPKSRKSESWKTQTIPKDCWKSEEFFLNQKELEDTNHSKRLSIVRRRILPKSERVGRHKPFQKITDNLKKNSC